MWKSPWQVPEQCGRSLKEGEAVGQDRTGEGRLVGWARPGCAGACRLQEGFKALRFNG